MIHVGLIVKIWRTPLNPSVWSIWSCSQTIEAFWSNTPLALNKLGGCLMIKWVYTGYGFTHFVIWPPQKSLGVGVPTCLVGGGRYTLIGSDPCQSQNTSWGYSLKSLKSHWTHGHCLTLYILWEWYRQSTITVSLWWWTVEHIAACVHGNTWLECALFFIFELCRLLRK